MKIGLSMEFDAAHHLPMHKGRCSQIHGHTYKVEVILQGSVGEDGMVMDFYELKRVVKKVIDELDHNDLNGILENPTAEIIASHIRRRVNEELDPFKVSLVAVKLWEGRDKWVMTDE